MGKKEIVPNEIGEFVLNKRRLLGISQEAFFGYYKYYFYCNGFVCSNSNVLDGHPQPALQLEYPTTTTARIAMIAKNLYVFFIITIFYISLG